VGYLQKHGEITNKGIEQLTGTTCPHDIIRKIRNKYGAGIILHEDIWKKKKVKIDGKEVNHSCWFRRYFLNKMEGLG
jgi:hypothetical protein